MSAGQLLVVENLRVELPIDGRQQCVIEDVSFSIAPGEALAVVGESGSGKSMTAKSICRILPPGAKVGGAVTFATDDVQAMDAEALRRYYTGGVSMIFQDPRAHMNPVRTIGDFLTEALRTNRGLSMAAALDVVEPILAEVGIEDGRRRFRQYPHELSGGLLQRVMIASALAVEPRLLIADEPTTALDVTTQMEVMAILDELRREHDLAMIFISHDLDLAEAICDRTAVMYAGRIVEEQRTETLHSNPLHPYTEALINSRPSVTERRTRLAAIPGRPVSAFEAPPGCAFAPRCPHATEVCNVGRPPFVGRGTGRVACLRVDELRGTSSPYVSGMMP